MTGSIRDGRPPEGKEGGSMVYGDARLLHEASGLTLSKQLALPDVIDAGEIFTVTEAREPVGLGCWDTSPGAYRPTEAEFTGYTILPTGAADVCLSEDALIALKRRCIGNCNFTLEVIDWKNGWSLVLANFDRILGGVWLALVETNTVPIGTNIHEYVKAHAQ